MAIQYVDSGALGTPDGTAWSTAWLTMDNITLNPGDIVYVDSTHSDSGSATYSWGNITTSPDPLQPVVFISVTNPGSDIAPTTYTRGAAITPGTLAMGHANQLFVFIGFDITPGGTTTIDPDSHIIYIDCNLTFSGGSIRTFSPGVNAKGEFYNCQINLGTNANSEFTLANAGSELVFYDCDLITNTQNDFIGNLGDGSRATIIGCDLSNATDLVEDNASGGLSAGVGEIDIFHTKFGTNVAGTNVVTNTRQNISGYGLSSGTDHHDIHIEDWAGTTNNDDANYRTSGATYDGTNEYSLKTVATGDAEPGVIGHRYKLCTFYADANPTITVEFATPTADTIDVSELWIDIWHPDSTGPTSSFINTRDTNYFLGTPSSLTTSSETWAGLTSPNKYKISKTITGGAAGIHEVWVNFAPSSAKTLYADPFITVA